MVATDPRSAHARAAVFAHAARQHGVFTSSDWRDAGIHHGLLAREVRRGSVRRIHPTTYVVNGAPHSWRQDLCAAVRSVGPDALASHRAAAALWQLGDTVGRTIEVVTTRHRRVGRAPFTVHECLDIRPGDRGVVDHIPVTAVPRTLLDLARFVPEERLGQCVDDAVRRRLSTYGALADWLGGVARPGVRGTRCLRAVLADRPGGTIPPGSTFEALALGLVRRHGLPEPVRQVPVRCGEEDFRIDIGWPDVKVGVEWDSRQHHSMPSQWEHDLWRQNLIQLEGWLLLRYTRRALLTRPDASTDEIRNALTTHDPQSCVDEARRRASSAQEPSVVRRTGRGIGRGVRRG
jgi:very-short-patch-repair endonuclease